MLKPGDVVIRDWGNDGLELGVVVQYGIMIAIETWDFIYIPLSNFNKWEVIGTL